jgi:methyl-accepting chemotaxis protein
MHQRGFTSYPHIERGWPKEERMRKTAASLVSLLILSGCLFTSCLNPISFDASTLPKLEVTGDFWTQSQDWASIVVVNLSKTLKITSLKTSITYVNDTDATITESREDLNPLFQRRIDLSVPSTKREGQSYDYTIEVRIADSEDSSAAAAITSSLKTQSNGTYYLYVYRAEYSDFGVPEPLDNVVVIPATTFNFYDTVPYYGPLSGDTLINKSATDMAILAEKLELIASLIGDLTASNTSLPDSIGQISQALEKLIANQADQSAASLVEIKKIVEALGKLPDNSAALEAIAKALDTLNTTNTGLAKAVIDMGTILSEIRDGQASALAEYKEMVAALKALQGDTASMLTVFNTMNGILEQLKSNGTATAGLLADINVSLKGLTDGLGGLTTVLNGLTSQMDGIKAALGDIGVEVVNQNAVLADIVDAITASKTDLSGVIAGLAEIKTELAGIKGEIGGITAQLTALNVNAEAQNVILGQIVTELVTTNTSLDAIKIALNGIKDEIAGIKTALNGLAASMDAQTAVLNAIVTAIGDTNATLGDIKDKLGEIKTEIIGVTTALNHLSEIADAQALFLNAIAKAIDATNVNLEDIKDELAGINTTLGDINIAIDALNVTVAGGNNVLMAISQTLIDQGGSLDSIIAVLEEIRDALNAGLSCPCSPGTCSCGGCLCGSAIEPPTVITYTVTSNVSKAEFDAHNTDYQYRTLSWVIEFSEPVSSVDWLDGPPPYHTGGFTGSGTTWETLIPQYGPKLGEWDGGILVSNDGYSIPYDSVAIRLKGTGIAPNTAIDESVHFGPVYREKAPEAPPNLLKEYWYHSSGFTNAQPFQRSDSVTYTLSWYLKYTTRESIDNGLTWNPVGETTLNNFGKWAIDGTNNGNYITFQQSGSYSNNNRTASIKIGSFVSGTYVKNDKAPRAIGSGNTWDLNTGLDFNEDLAALGFEIKGMPSATIPLYLLSWQIGTTTKSNYQALTFKIKN